MDLLTAEEVAEMVRAPVGSLRWWRYSGTGPPSAKLGKKIVYRRGDVERWISAKFDEQAAVEAARR
jgi:hypothetical protein